MTVAVLNWAIKRVEAGERVAIASVVQASGSVPGKPGARLAISSSGEKFGTIGGAGLELKVEKELQEILLQDLSDLRKKGGKVESFLLNRDGKGKEASALDSLCGGQVKVAMEVITPRPHILIAGGGHVGLSIAKVCDSLEWLYSVFDVREEYCNRQRYPNAEGNFCSSVEEFLQKESSDSMTRFSDILLLSHDWSVDEEMLIGLLQLCKEGRRPRIGAIGSKKKWSAFEKKAIENGVEKRLIDSVRCPIGLDIGADTPEEIAIAVCAEVLSLERKNIAT
ncbi:MAG: XdhC/CoxI family protein [Candidatus Thermoplasmatota archaeon]|nr:XdhC/CoxI family protein [Candidatus Thermoplasmatota archaeon]MEC7459089.1 XdhC/CoxI family protein [Candidatus Thermoplasmatota archaeon]